MHHQFPSDSFDFYCKVAPGPNERLMPNDRLVVLGEREAVEQIKLTCPMGAAHVANAEDRV